MPIYEYQCESCQRDFEELVRSNRTAKPTCPHCGSRETQRAISTFAAGQSKGGLAKGDATGASGDMPMCGRCGDFGPCGGG